MRNLMSSVMLFMLQAIIVVSITITLTDAIKKREVECLCSITEL